MSDRGTDLGTTSPDDTPDPAEPVETGPTVGYRADPVATGIAVLVAASLLTCALLALIAAGNA